MTEVATAAATAEPGPPEAGWEEADHYEFRLASDCGERSLLGQFRVVVEAGEVVAVEALDESAQRITSDPELRSLVPSLRGLMAEVASARGDGADVVEVSFGAAGQPSSIDIDWDVDATDDEACYRISGYREFTRPVVWPPVEEDPAGADCVYRYPDDLARQAYAFDGTIVAAVPGVYSEDAAGTPFDLVVRINEVFKGELDGLITMHTWNFGNGDPDPVGARILAAAGETLDVMSCGFTRPYEPDEAELWRSIFNE